jgi:hypothetical protein
MVEKPVWVNGSPRDGGFIEQKNFYALVPPQELEVVGLPSRTLSTFWNQDIVPTAIKIRSIYVRHYNHQDDDLLTAAWNWLKAGKNEEVFGNASFNDPDVIKNLPIEVALNRQTLLFFLMHDDFKRNPCTERFEPFVAYTPDTKDWGNDIRRKTFAYYEKLTTLKMPVERRNIEVMLPEAKNELLKRVDEKEEILERYDCIDSITHILLMKYHLELLKCENAMLE